MPTEPWKPESVPPKLQCAGSSSDVVDCPPGGRTKEGQPRRCCHWGAGLLLRWDHFHLLFTPPVQILLLLGGYCTGDNYRDERPIDVFVLNTSNYRWTEVLVPSSSHELLSNVHVAYWSTLVQTGQDIIYLPTAQVAKPEDEAERAEWPYQRWTQSQPDVLFWRQLPRRYGHTVIAWGDAIYLFGGRNDEAACNVLYRWSETTVWSWIFWASVDIDELISIDLLLFCRFDTNTFSWSRPKGTKDVLN